MTDRELHYLRSDLRMQKECGHGTILDTCIELIEELLEFHKVQDMLDYRDVTAFKHFDYTCLAGGCQTLVLRAEINRLKQWVDDLQTSIYVNCVYCGFRYGVGDEWPTSIVNAAPTMSKALTAHVEQCPAHPMNHLRKEVARLTRLLNNEEGNQERV